jgi:23S rRNA pseudouridine1911/1915/1917 synthase
MSTEGAQRHEFRLEADSDVRLDSLVAARIDVSRTAAATLVANGRVLIDGRREKSSYKPRAGELVIVDVPPPPGRPIEGEAIPLDVVFEDEDLIVVNKPAGMVVHPAPGNWTGTLVNALIGRGGDLSDLGGEDRAGLVHRLDKETSGLLLVARTERAHRILGAALAARQIERRYAALCWGHLDAETLLVDRPLARDPRDRQRMAVVQGGKPARTTFVRLGRFDSVDLLRCQLHTGRTHQIRVHLAAIGHPVVGDDTYGGGGGRRIVKLPPRRHFLHAASLRFRHPRTEDMLDLRAPLPSELRIALAAVGSDPAFADDPMLLERFSFFDSQPASP